MSKFSTRNNYKSPYKTPTATQACRTKRSATTFMMPTASGLEESKSITTVAHGHTAEKGMLELPHQAVYQAM